ncbi:unnamed protein product [Acanthoscelides obtectus]|uniref:Uncharacterized protein n=1 Tax=Acanthoscelides obtectus TaxID=200917 RepID=A0A9P0P6C4_ACAOB|nr:unnamed protein product [Acanthoscelides obtectus]CAK1676794.1 hypothetical protein AOBTE_LOCUS30945 [Acanthoscelides obtectus]
MTCNLHQFSIAVVPQ